MHNTEMVTASRLLAPHIHLRIESSRYLIKTVDSISELHQALLLRGKVFSEEYGGSQGTLDVDSFDFSCEHLVIVEKENNQVVGTYRLLCSKFTQSFYSQTEFHLTEFLEIPGVKLELGRACIAKEHRRGAVLNLLWRGIVQYAKEVGAEYLFGCSSVHTESPTVAKLITQKLRACEAYEERWNIEPHGPFQLPNLEECNSDPLFSEEAEIPPLLQSYLNSGAMVIGPPAHDANFHCIDFFTVLKMSSIQKAYEKRYQN
jgi:putative hemolysin